MAKYVLAVYEACQDYLERFMNYAGGKNHLSFRIKGYTDLTILADDMQNSRIDAVLFSVDELFYETLKNSKILLMQIIKDKMIALILGEQHSAGELRKMLEELGYEGEVPVIDKYQPVESILLEADEYIQLRKGKIDQIWTDPQFQIKGLYSPMDKVTHPEAVPFLRGEEEKLLYLNLEPFSGLERLAEIPASSDLSDAIYYYKTAPGKLSEILNRIKGRLNGFDYLQGLANADDLEILEGEDWPGFLKALAKTGYQLIIIDSCIFSRKLFDVILSYGSLYIPALPYDSSRTFRSVLTAQAAGEERRRMRMAARMKEFREYYESAEMAAYRERIFEVQIETD